MLKTKFANSYAPKFPRKITRFFRSVRFRLSLWYVVILAVVLVIFGSIVYTTQAANLHTEIDNNLRTTAQQLTPILTDENNQLALPSEIVQLLEQSINPTDNEQLFKKLQTAVPNLKSLLQGHYILMLVDTSGEAIQTVGSINPQDVDWLAIRANKMQWQTIDYLPTSEPGTNTNFAVKNSENFRVYFLPVSPAKGNFAPITLVLGLPWQGASDLQGLLLTLLIAGPLTLLIAAAGGYWLASRAMRPIQQITRAAYTISETDLSRRLNIKSRDELGELAATFDLMLSRLDSAFERQRQFTADASHELRTPLTVINLEANRALTHQRNLEEYEATLALIRGESEYMSRLVNDLLTLARADAGRATLQLEKVDLGELVLEAIERLAPLAHQQRIELIAADLPELWVCGDSLYLMRMLTNLIENAIKYTSGIGTQVIINGGFTSDTDNNQDQSNGGQKRIWLTIDDDGPGIAPEYLPYLFDRFYQVDKARTRTETEQKGSGLGLSIVQWVAQVHGGSVTVESKFGAGTTFEVKLPLHEN